MSLAEDRVMSFPRKLVEHRILALESPLNRHLVKLVAFDFAPEVRRHFRREVDNWLFEIQSMRFKPDNPTGSVKFYFDLLFDYPFGGVEVENTQKMMDLVSREYDEVRPTKTAEQMADWLRAFHEELAERLHKGEDVFDMIPE